MVGWHQPLNGHESEQTLGDSEGQGSLVCCSPYDLVTEQQQHIDSKITFSDYFEVLEELQNCLPLEASLVVQWLKLFVSNTGDMGPISSQGTKIPHAAWCSQKIKLKKVCF